MKNSILLLLSFVFFLLPFLPAQGGHYAGELNGYILLQVEENGEAWYVYPNTGKKYFLGRPNDAFAIMKALSLGAKHSYISETNIFPARLSGRILLDVEQNGEAYYIYPKNLQKYYLGRPADAFRIMSELGLGANNASLVNIPVGDVNEKPVELPPSRKILLDVPFVPQAPFGNWSDQRQQDGCEESSALMAVRWARGETITYDEALEEIIAISDFEQKKYGEYRDISAADTISWIMNDYLKFTNAELRKNISVNDIIAELERGNLIITPMNGQIMHNPYFTPPGPPRHMIVIKGYDPERNVFITNDPGTRNGRGFEYDAKVLFESIRDYPTGYHEKIEVIEKNMIVVSR